MSSFIDVPEAINSQESDWEFLISSARGGCQDSFQELCERVYDYLILVAGSRIRHNMQGKFGASDIVQVGLAKAHSAMGGFNGTDEQQFRAWLKKVVINSLLNETRQFESKKREVERECALMGEELPQDDLSPSKIAVYNEEQKLLKKNFTRLTETERLVIEMHSRFGYSFSETAEYIGFNECKVRRIFNRGVARLKSWCSEDNQSGSGAL